jgi:hypothetical protein
MNQPKNYRKVIHVETRDDDDSMGAVFRDMQADKRRRREQHRQAFADSKLCKSRPFTQHTDTHFSLASFLGDRLDYWPSGCRWRWCGRSYTGDVKSFEGWLRNQEKEEGLQDLSDIDMPGGFR